MPRRLRPNRPQIGDDERRFRRMLRWPTGAAAVLFLLLLWNFGFHPLRSALPGGTFSGFFDDQAVSLLHGRLDLEKGAAGIEAFVVDGKEYIYFPPGPAILRMPVVAFTERFEGRLTAPSMLMAWALLAFVTSRLWWEVRRCVRGEARLGRWELGMFGLLHFSVLGGSVVLHLASMPWVYHEAYMWSMALTLGAVLTMIRLQERPTGRRVAALGAYATGAMMVRTTAGWALAGSILLYAAWILVRRRGTPVARLLVPLIAAGVVPLVLGISVNWAKFSHPYLFPLEKQVFTGLNEQRQRALAANGGDLVSFEILPSTLNAYFRPDGVRVNSVFPYVGLPTDPAPTVGDAVIDQSYRTGSVPAMMPLLFLLSSWGGFALVTPATRGPTARLRLPVLATMLAGGPVMFYGYLAYRYTSEFVPALVVGSAIGLSDLARRWAGRSVRFKRVVVGAASFAVAFGAYANFASGVTAMSVTNPGPMLERYVRAQMRMDDLFGGSFDRLVVQAGELPRTSVTDQIRILGDCDAAFVGTGDVYGPWELLAMREWNIDLRVADVPAEGERLLLATAGVGADEYTIGAEVQPARVRTLVTWPDRSFVGEWYPVDAGGTFRFEVLVNTEYRVWSIEPAPETEKIVVPIITFGGDMNFPRFLQLRTEGSPHVQVSATPRPPLPLCEELLARAVRR